MNWSVIIEVVYCIAVPCPPKHKTPCICPNWNSAESAQPQRLFVSQWVVMVGWRVVGKAQGWGSQQTWHAFSTSRHSVSFYCVGQPTILWSRETNLFNCFTDVFTFTRVLDVQGFQWHRSCNRNMNSQHKEMYQKIWV